jgi:hypothetical protein
MVEAKDKTIKDWVIVESAGREPSNTYSPGIFGYSYDTYKFRLAPEPPAKKWRPWTAEEVPIGALTRSKVPNEILMIIGRNETGVRLADDDGWYSYDSLVKARTCSTDNGKTWLPCGVEVTE